MRPSSLSLLAKLNRMQPVSDVFSIKASINDDDNDDKNINTRDRSFMRKMRHF